ncbi:meiotic nuclear division protein 1 homolog [Xenia sp. Carnegie-2017]|uniref:meiotic nuclear division protein 1 homolog n=1 Tax=Xenia sp. Carnegie-2017 TaxID=2897299 RepID=UPI001F049ECE|nr:meiotic nuclear division protein 1 homolog [Xenia sp. Carnegie-2017]
MSRKRGLSLDEKRKRIMDIFFDTKDFFQLKEIEKIASKEKGINSMVVKEIVQGLVDDNLVDTEKIGTSNYFWSFPSKVVNSKKTKLEQLKNNIKTLENKKKQLIDNIDEAKMTRVNNEEREEILNDLVIKEELNLKLAKDLEKYKECDPEVIEKMSEEAKIAQESANRWTDNIFSIKSWCTKSFGVDEKAIDKNFGIPEDFDYLE